MGSRLAFQREPLLSLAQRMFRNVIVAARTMECTLFVPRLGGSNWRVADSASVCVSRKSTTETTKSCRFSEGIFSQAGRRGFDPRLPLHVFNNLGRIHDLKFNAINALSSRSPRGARSEGAATPSDQIQNHSRSLNLKEPHTAAPCAVIE